MSFLWPALEKPETAIDKLHKRVILQITEKPDEWVLGTGRYWNEKVYRRNHVSISDFYSHRVVQVHVEGSGTFQQQFTKLQRKQLVEAIKTLKTYLALQTVLRDEPIPAIKETDNDPD